MIISYNRIQSYIKETLPSPDILANIITAKLFEIEEKKQVGQDVMFDIKVLADRASYCYGHRFVAREIAAIIGGTYSVIDFTDTYQSIPGIRDLTNIADIAHVQNTTDFIDVPDINIDNLILTHACVKYQGRVIKGIKNGPSPKWLVDFLVTVSVRSINLIVDLTNFVMLDVGQPMHAFDIKKIEGAISVRFAKKQEQIELLDGRVIKFDDESVLVIADQKGPIAIAGVKGGKRTEVTDSTTDILLESANFESVCVRKTAEKYNIKNDSTKRFENKVSLERTDLAMFEFFNLLKTEQLDIACSKIVTIENLNIVKDRTTPKQMTFSMSSVIKRIKTNYIAQSITESFVSSDISNQFIVNTLNSLDLLAEIDEDNADLVHVHIPVYRNDISIKEDIVDEIGRIYGYEQLHAVSRLPITSVCILPSFFYIRKIKIALGLLGFSEVYTHTLISRGDYELANPLNIDRSHLRNTLSENFSEVLFKNLIHVDYLGLDKIIIFEIGKVYESKKERLSLAIGIATKEGKNKSQIIQTIQSFVIESISNIFNIEPSRFPVSIRGEGIIEIDIESLIAGAQIPDHDARINQNNIKLVDGILDDKTQYLSGAESLSRKLAEKQIVYKKFSPYPYIIRDIAVFIPGPTGNAHKLKKVITDIETILIVSIRQFDEFEKRNKETGEVQKTSYAFRVIFQSHEKTLTDLEVEEIMNKINLSIASHKEWEIR